MSTQKAPQKNPRSSNACFFFLEEVYSFKTRFMFILLLYVERTMTRGQENCPLPIRQAEKKKRNDEFFFLSPFFQQCNLQEKARTRTLEEI